MKAFVVLVALALSPTPGKDLAALSPKALLEEIRKDTGAVFKNDTVFYKVLAKVQSGDSEWVDLAFSLQSKADGHFSEELSLALGEALGNKPQFVFKGIRTEWDISLI